MFSLSPSPSLNRVLLPALLLSMLGLVSGCAGLTPAPPSAAALSPLEQAVRAGDCGGAANIAQTIVADSASDAALVVAAQTCLRQGDFEQAHNLAVQALAQPVSDDQGDYAAYLKAVSGFGLWSLASRSQPQIQVEQGRALFQEITNYLYARPLSVYTDELAPRLPRLREGIAAGELRLAQAAYRDGRHDAALARADYIIEYYSRTQAAAEAAQWRLER